MIMCRPAAFVLFLAFGTVFQLSHGTEVTVKDQDKMCLYANLTVTFSVSYNQTDGKTKTVEFPLPSVVKTDGSVCGATSSTLKLSFGEGHSWTVNFTKGADKYQADFVTFSYNLSDASVFPDSASNSTLSVAVKPHITDVDADSCYSCRSNEVLVDSLVNQTLQDVTIQAFVNNGSKCEKLTHCAADLPTTAPTSIPTTTTAPTTTTTPTTVAPVTNTTEPASTTTATTTPTPTLPPPTVGKYNLTAGVNGSTCLLAAFGLRIGLKQGDKYEEMNLNPNLTSATGSCGVNSSQLVLTAGSMTLVFSFTNDTHKFRLNALNVTGKTSSGAVFSEANSNLTLWEAAVGTSYMCNKEQNYTITGLLTLYTFNLQIQPFGVQKGAFSTAEECFLDSDLSFLVPIAVGVALSFLIILVLISYLIGRRKSRTGYQSV